MTRLYALPLLLLGCAESSAPPSSALAPEAGTCSDPACAPTRTVLAPPSSGALEPDAPAGARCDSALALAGSGDSALLLSLTAAAPAPLGCAPALGAAGAYFVLDLSAAQGPVPVQLVFDAPVPFEVGLARGACGDLRVEQCAAPLYPDGRSRVISATLAPDRYLLIVDSNAAGAELHVSASAGAASGSAAPTNDECTTALALDSRIPLQSVSGTLAGAQPSVNVRCSAFQAADVFYTLDLTDRPGETLLDVDVSGPNERPVTAALFAAPGDGCGELSMCGAQFSARLAPGMYRLGVSDAVSGFPNVAAESKPFHLRIGLDQEDCSQALNDSWQTAVELDPTAELQRVQGNTVCGKSQLDPACFGDRGAPEQYYRLDLRGAPGPRLLEVESLLGPDTVNYVVLADAAGGAPRITSCDPLLDTYAGYDLAPRIYYLVVDGRVRNAARFELELRLRDEGWGIRPCVSQAMTFCMKNSEPACADSMADPRCLSTSVECGLEQAAYDAFCSAVPGCCSGTQDAASCLQAWQSTVECR